jgi:hypothetical protein
MYTGSTCAMRMGEKTVKTLKGDWIRGGPLSAASARSSVCVFLPKGKGMQRAGHTCWPDSLNRSIKSGRAVIKDAISQLRRRKKCAAIKKGRETNQLTPKGIGRRRKESYWGKQRNKLPCHFCVRLFALP